MKRRRLVRYTAYGLGALLLAAAGLFALGLYQYTKTYDTETIYAEGFEQAGYLDFDGKPVFKLAMQHVGDRWYLFAAHMWHRGWSIVDVTDPAKPRYVTFIPGPANTLTVNLSVSNGLMIAALERPVVELIKYLPWEGYVWLAWKMLIGEPLVVPGAAFEEGVWLFDVRDPENPVKVGEWHGGATGTHRNFYAGGDYAWLAAHKPGFRGHQLVVLDVSEPSDPKEVGAYYDPEQRLSDSIEPEFHGYYHHGPAHVEGDRAYVPYGVRGAKIFDVSDVANPRLVGELNPMAQGLGSEQGVHTFIPLTSRGLAVINTEAHDESCAPDPGRSYTAIIDIADETKPNLVSLFPEAKPDPAAPYDSFCDRPGRAGVHNQHHHNNEPHLYRSDRFVFLTSFNGGLRLYDTIDPENVKEIGYFVPPDPEVRSGVFPTRMVVQTEDVLVDARGYAYITHKNQGVHIVRATHPAFVEDLEKSADAGDR